MDGSFERAVARRLRDELDGLNVASPAAARLYARRGSMRYAWAVGRTLAVALAVALLLGSVAAFASGDPGKFVKSAEQSLGIPPFDDKPPIGSRESPSPHSESPEPTEPSSGSQREPAESPTPEPTERASPETESPEPRHSSEPPEHSPGPSPGDD